MGGPCPRLSTSPDGHQAQSICRWVSSASPFEVMYLEEWQECPVASSSQPLLSHVHCSPVLEGHVEWMFAIAAFPNHPLVLLVSHRVWELVVSFEWDWLLLGPIQFYSLSRGSSYPHSKVQQHCRASSFHCCPCFSPVSYSVISKLMEGDKEKAISLKLLKPCGRLQPLIEGGWGEKKL